MKSTGMVRRVDELGRIVVPAEIRQSLDIHVKDRIEIFTEGDRIVLRKYTPACIFCGSEADLKFFHDKRVCKACIANLMADTEQAAQP